MHYDRGATQAAAPSTICTNGLVNVGLGPAGVNAHWLRLDCGSILWSSVSSSWHLLLYHSDGTYQVHELLYSAVDCCIEGPHVTVVAMTHLALPLMQTALSRDAPMMRKVVGIL